MLPLEALPDDPGEPPYGGGFRGAVEEELHGTVVFHVDGQKEGRLAFVDPGQAVRIVGDTPGGGAGPSWRIAGGPGPSTL